jgi:hypothetical protein
MTDIVQRLRHPPFGTETSERNVMNQAADEIERLRKALEDIASGQYSGRMLMSLPPQDPAVNRARAALEDK